MLGLRLPTRTRNYPHNQTAARVAELVVTVTSLPISHGQDDSDGMNNSSREVGTGGKTVMLSSHEFSDRPWSGSGDL